MKCMEEEKMCLNLQEASKYLGINIKSMSALTKVKGFPCIFVGRRTLVLKNKLEEWFIKNYGRYF